MKSQYGNSFQAKRKLSKFINNINISIKLLSDINLLNNLTNEENNNLINLLEILTRIQYNFSNNSATNHVAQYNIDIINTTLTSDGQIKLNYSTSNNAKIKIIKEYFEFNKFQEVFNTLFVMDLLEQSTTKVIKEVEESTFSFKLNCEMKAEAGYNSKSSAVSGYIIGDDTGFTSTLLTSFLSTSNITEFGNMFPGVVSKRLSSKEVLSSLSGTLLTKTEVVIFQNLVTRSIKSNEYTVDELNCFILLHLLTQLLSTYSEVKSNTGILSTHLCAIHSLTKTKVFSVGTLTGTIDVAVKYRTFKNTIGYNKLLKEINSTCTTEEETKKFYANEINNSKALTNLLIELIEDFYKQI